MGTLEPGKLGIAFNQDTGAISRVNEGCQCASKGVHAGWTFKTIDGIPYNKDLMTSKIKGTAPYEVTLVPCKKAQAEADAAKKAAEGTSSKDKKTDPNKDSAALGEKQTADAQEGPATDQKKDT